jgi:hypothetical protein
LGHKYRLKSLKIKGIFCGITGHKVQGEDPVSPGT